MRTCHLFQKIIEKAIATQIHHLINNDIADNFKSAYKTGHSCETALLRVYNDIVTTIGRGNGAMLVLLDLFDAFDTIDHDNLFCILEKYVGICGNALTLRGRPKTTWRRTITTELSDMGLTMGEAQMIAQDRHRWRRDIVALCPTLG